MFPINHTIPCGVTNTDEFLRRMRLILDEIEKAHRKNPGIILVSQGAEKTKGKPSKEIVGFGFIPSKKPDH